ncbi:hypothetical protein RRG08_050691 [Elysia crispata]|uniref:Uncharacterized protein n=1 Tax=Elysia crispata TaxID=231223 RepID=A0AAE1A4X5_9GAST|nr:hypothetical protein RRG08_050691 [Elysia crispata]
MYVAVGGVLRLLQWVLDNEAAFTQPGLILEPSFLKWRVDEFGSPIDADVWDIPGSQIHREAHLLYIARPCVVLLVTSADHQLTEVMSILTGVVHKFPDVKILLTVTSRGEVTDDDSGKDNTATESLSAAVRTWVTQKKTALKQNMEQIRTTVTTVLSSHSALKSKAVSDEQTLISTLTERVQEALSVGHSLTDAVLTINTSTHEGVPQLRQKLLESLTGKTAQTETPELPSYLSKHYVYGVTLEMTESGIVLLPKREFSEILRDKLLSQYSKQWKESLLEEVIRYLIREPSGCDALPKLTNIYDDHRSRESGVTKQEMSAVNKTGNGSALHHKVHEQSYICVDPETFANMISACIIEDNKRTFRLEAGRFWPPESGFQPPDPASLARVLEDIPSHGVIREAVLPLLWQDFELSETQIQHCVALLQHLGVFMDHQMAQTDIAGLAMPDYLGLSAVQCHTFVLMNLLPNIKPQLNWTSRPYKGDLQVCWKLQALASPPVSVLRRSLALLKGKYHQACLYSHMWRDGLLIKFDEVNMCIELSTSGLDITARVNGDEPGVEHEAVARLWAHLVPAVVVLERVLHQELPGAVFNASLSVHGEVFFNMVSTNQDVELSLERCLLAWQAFGGHMTVLYREETRQVDLELLFPFKGDEAKNVWTPTDFKSLVMKKQPVIVGGQRQIVNEKTTTATAQRRVTLARTRSKRQTPKKKVVSVTWKSHIAEDLEKKASSPVDKVKQTNRVAFFNIHPTPTYSSPSIGSNSKFNRNFTLPDNYSKNHDRYGNNISSRGHSTTRLQPGRGCEGEERAGRTLRVCYDGYWSHEISAAEATAQAAMAVHTGHLDGAASAVIDALRAAHAPSVWGKARASKSGQGKSSKTCSVF